jgi:hypothetical protein
MNPDLVEKVHEALEGWLSGDISPLEDLMDPDVELLWWRTGEGEVRGKSDVLGLISQRASQRGSGVTIDVTKAGEDALIVTRVVPPSEGPLPATLITFRDGLIVKLHQFRSTDEALKAAPFRARS